MADQAAKEVQDRQLRCVSFAATKVGIEGGGKERWERERGGWGKGREGEAYGFPSFPNTTPLGNFLGNAPGVGGGVRGASFDAAVSLFFSRVDSVILSPGL